MQTIVFNIKIKIWNNAKSYFVVEFFVSLVLVLTVRPAKYVLDLSIIDYWFLNNM